MNHIDVDEKQFVSNGKRLKVLKERRRTKLSQDKDPAIMRLMTVQIYDNKSFNFGEINDEQKKLET